MNRSVRIIPYVIFAFLLGSCQTGQDLSDKTVVSVSILPQKYFIEKIAGDLIEVNVLIPPGASPATYEPTLAQLSRLHQSKVYMLIGFVGFELSWMDKIQSVNPEMKIIDLSTGVNFIYEDSEEEEEEHHGHSHGGIEPHIWMSAINAKIIASNIFRELVLLLPGEEERMQKNHSEFQNEMDSLHRTISEHMQTVGQRNFLIYHPALSYFSRDYDLHQYSIEIEGKTPSPAHLKKLTDLSLEKDITTIFVQSQFDKRHAEILAEEVDAEIVQFNPLDEQWNKQMLYIVEQFKQP